MTKIPLESLFKDFSKVFQKDFLFLVLAYSFPAVDFLSMRGKVWLSKETPPLKVRRDHIPYNVWKQQGYLKTLMVMLSIMALSKT